MARVYSWVRGNLSLFVAACIALPVYAFIAYKNAKIDMLFADAISDNNFLQLPLIPHDINIQAIHTHFLKWPIALLENAIGFNFHTHAIISFLLLVAMNVALVYLFYIFSRRNKFITAICLLLLTSVELMTGISANEGTLTMITIRNIELPLTIGAVLALIRQRRLVSFASILATLILAVIFVTDQLLLFTSVIGIFFYALFTFMRHEEKLPSLLRDKTLFAGVVAGAVVSKAIVVLIQAVGIANFYEMRNTNDKLSFVSSFSGLFESTLNNIGEIFDVFGAGFFGQQLEYGPLYFINIGLLLATVYFAIKLFKNKTRQDTDVLDKTLIALFCMYFFAMLIFTVFIPRELAGRYFAFLPILGILLVAKEYERIQVRLLGKRSWGIFAASSLSILLLFFIMTLLANNIYYKQKYAMLSSSLGDTSTIVNILQKEKATVYITMDIYERGYWTGQVIKQQYDEKAHDKLSIGSVFCDNFIIDRQFTRKSWVTPSGKKVAVRVHGCDVKKIEQRLGNPSSIYNLAKDDALLIYQQDIRGKFRTDQFDTNSFVK